MAFFTITVDYALKDGDNIRSPMERTFLVVADTFPLAVKKIISMFAGNPKFTFKVMASKPLNTFNGTPDVYSISGKTL